MAIVLIPFDGRILISSVHALELTVRPRVVWLGQSMFNAIGRADHVEPHGPTRKPAFSPFEPRLTQFSVYYDALVRKRSLE